MSYSNNNAGGRVLGLAGMARAAWRYRPFIVSSIATDYRTRFVRSKLGLLWIIIHPLVNAAILALVLSEVMAARLPGMAGDKHAYALYVMAGVLAWSLFSEVVSRCTGIFIENGSMLKKLRFPRICLPLIVTGSSLLNNVMLFAAIVGMFVLIGRAPGVHSAWIPLLMLIPLGLGLGAGLLLGVFNVFVRDIGQVVPVVLQLGFWFAPIIYPPSILPDVFAGALWLNPMTPVVQAYQDAMLYDRAPDWNSLGWIAVLAATFLATSLFMFRRASAELVDAL